METNERGNTVERGFEDGARYKYDFRKCTRDQGWKQYDTSQDAWYFGVWVHPERREIFSYVEGDLILVKCPTEESYHAELASMAEFYGPPPPAYTFIDTGSGQITKVYDKRPV